MSKLIQRFFINYKNVLNKKYFIIYFLYFFFFLSNGPLETSIPLLFENYGYHGNIYGIFLSINNIINIILPFGISYIANKYGSIFIGLVAMAMSFIGALISGLLPNYIFIIYPACLFIIMGRTTFNYSYGNAINYTISQNMRGKYFAIRDLFLFSSISLGLFIGSFIIAKKNVSFMFVIYSVIFIIPAYLMKISVKDCEQKESANNINLNDSKSKKIDREHYRFNKMFKNKRFLGFFLVGVGATVYSTSLLFLPLLGTSIGISVPKILTMFGAITFINSMVALLIGNVSDFVNRKWLFIFDIAFDMIPAIVFAFTKNISLFIIGILCTMIKDAFAPSSFAYFYDCFEENEGIVIQGFLSSIDNAISFLAPILIGFLWDKSKRLVFLLGAFGSFFSTIVAAILLPNIKTNDKKPNITNNTNNIETSNNEVY